MEGRCKNDKTSVKQTGRLNQLLYLNQEKAKKLEMLRKQINLMESKHSSSSVGSLSLMQKLNLGQFERETHAELTKQIEREKKRNLTEANTKLQLLHKQSQLTQDISQIKLKIHQLSRECEGLPKHTTEAIEALGMLEVHGPSSIEQIQFEIQTLGKTSMELKAKTLELRSRKTKSLRINPECNSLSTLPSHQYTLLRSLRDSYHSHSQNKFIQQHNKKLLEHFDDRMTELKQY